MLADKLRRASGSASGLFVDDLFSTYLYTGNGSTQTITNGIDLAGKGGMVWIKDRSVARSNLVFDSERVVSYPQFLITDTTSGEVNAQRVSSFNETGFTLINSVSANAPTENYTSWTFRKAPKFFDVVTYTGDGVAGRQIPHNLDGEVGSIFIKCTNNVSNWAVWHRENPDPSNDYLHLNLDVASGSSSAYWNSTMPTSTEFTVGNVGPVNLAGWSYVAYLFAHNDGDGVFGENGDEDIIKCGSYTGNGLTDGPEINLGFEPQYILVKSASGTGSWYIFDSMRGIVASSDDMPLQADTYASEANLSGSSSMSLTATGFKLTTNSGPLNTNSHTYIYIAIRRPHKPAKSGSEVFAIDGNGSDTNPAFRTTWPVDMGMYRDVSAVVQMQLSSRLTQGNRLRTDNTDAETSSSFFEFDYQNGWGTGGESANVYSWMFKRSRGFFDVVCYDGVSAVSNYSHNLTVAPEMFIIKCRSDASTDWIVYHKDLGNTKRVLLNSSAGEATQNVFNNTSPTDIVFTVASGFSTNTTGRNYITYLFATQAGISKVGSFTGNGSSQTIDCGFSTGARFFLVKATSTTGSWWVFDSARGIVSSFDPALQLNSTAAEITTADAVDPTASGIIVNQEATCSINATGVSYVYLAIS